MRTSLNRVRAVSVELSRALRSRSRPIKRARAAATAEGASVRPSSSPRRVRRGRHLEPIPSLTAHSCAAASARAAFLEHQTCRRAFPRSEPTRDLLARSGALSEPCQELLNAPEHERWTQQDIADTAASRGDHPERGSHQVDSVGRRRTREACTSAVRGNRETRIGLPAPRVSPRPPSSLEPRRRHALRHFHLRKSFGTPHPPWTKAHMGGHPDSLRTRRIAVGVLFRLSLAGPFATVRVDDVVPLSPACRSTPRTAAPRRYGALSGVARERGVSHEGVRPQRE